MGKRILIIKLASAGDVLRTTPLAVALKKKYPRSFITWLVSKSARELLSENPYIDRIVEYETTTVLPLLVERFDIVISLDKAIEAVSLAAAAQAGKKYGFGLTREGKISHFNRRAVYSFLLGIDDDLKFRRNQKTYQELIFEACGLPYRNERYVLVLNAQERQAAEEFFKKNELDRAGKIIGINTGAGRVFANKNLKAGRIIELAELLQKRLNVAILLLGGPLEREINAQIIAQAQCRVYDSGCNHTLKEFSALVDKCSLVITADTLALHIAIALKKPVVALFGPTCAQEIELYNQGRKIITNAPCAPCYRSNCGELSTCMDRISTEEIVKAAESVMASPSVLRV